MTTECKNILHQYFFANVKYSMSDCNTVPENSSETVVIYQLLCHIPLAAATHPESAALWPLLHPDPVLVAVYLIKNVKRIIN